MWKELEAYQPTSGKQLWATEMACSSIPSTSYDGNQLFVPSKGLTLLELGSLDQPPKQAWNNNKLGANSASPIVYKGSVYTVNRTVLVKGDALTENSSGNCVCRKLVRSGRPPCWLASTCLSLPKMDVALSSTWKKRAARLWLPMHSVKTFLAHQPSPVIRCTFAAPIRYGRFPGTRSSMPLERNSLEQVRFCPASL